MNISIEQLKLLEDYRDKTYVSAILCEKSSNFYTFYKNLFNIPLILTSSIMSIINSTNIDQDKLKYINVVINGLTALTITFINQYKFSEKSNIFKSSYLKFTKLLHNIEDSLINNKNNITTDNIREYINIYDTLYENLIDTTFPESIKNRVRELYKNNRVLPNILNCETKVINNDLVIVNK